MLGKEQDNIVRYRTADYSSNIVMFWDPLVQAGQTGDILPVHSLSNFVLIRRSPKFRRNL